MVGVKFGDYHSYDDWGLILVSVENPNPEPKYNFVSITGSSDVIDLTDIYGEVNYEQRELKFRFLSFDPYEERYGRNGNIANALHGQKLEIRLDDDKGHFYLGRVNFETWEVDKRAHFLTFTCICDPYRYDNEKASKPWKWDTFSFVDGTTIGQGTMIVEGELITSLIGTNKVIYPKAIASAQLKAQLNGGKWVTIPRGESTLYEMPIPRGEKQNQLILQGNGTVTFDYRGVTF